MLHALHTVGRVPWAVERPCAGGSLEVVPWVGALPNALYGPRVCAHKVDLETAPVGELAREAQLAAAEAEATAGGGRSSEPRSSAAIGAAGCS